VSDDPDGKIAAARAEWTKHQENLIEEVAGRLLGLAIESFIYFTKNDSRTRVSAHALASLEQESALEDMKDRFEAKFTQWVVDNQEE
jgi:hypothetical protein